MMLLKKLTTGVVLIGFLVLLAACGASEDNEPVAIVNGEEIPTYRFNEQVERMKSSYEQQGIDFESEDGAPFLDMIEQQVLNTLIQQTVLMQASSSAGIEVSDETLETEFSRIRGQFDSEEMFQDALEHNGFTEESFREILYMETKIEKFFEASVDSVDISDEDIEEYYDDYVEQMEQNDQEPEELEEIWDLIENQIEQEAQNAQFGELVDDLMAQSDIENLLENSDE